LQGVGAVVGALSRNLHELQKNEESQGSFLSIYDQPTLPLQVFSTLTLFHHLMLSFMISVNVFRKVLVAALEVTQVW